jgi:tetratricopeptide (TPR) repeat protein
MNRHPFFFLVGGLAIGILIGFGSYHAVHTTPDLHPETAGGAAPGGSLQRGPMGGPAGPGQLAGAPMVKRINELKRQLQTDAEDLAALTELAHLHYDASMWEQAAEYYERVAEIQPDANMLTDLGVCYRERGDHQPALDRFARAQEVDPRHWQSLYNTMVVTAFDLGRYDLATEALDAMEAISPPPAGLDRERLAEIREMLERMAGEAGEPS